MKHFEKSNCTLVIVLLLVSLSSCMKRNLAGDYTAKIYHYPQGGTHTNIEKTETKEVTDSLGVVHSVDQKIILHVEPSRMETTIRFYLNMDEKLNLIATYSKGAFTPPTSYFGKGKLKKNSLIIDFYRRETKDSGLGGKVYDSLAYSPPLSLRFSLEKVLKKIHFSYFPNEQTVDSLDEYWSSHYSFETQEEHD